MKYKKDVGYIKSPIPCGIEPFIIIDIKCVERLAKAIKSPLQARIESVLSILLEKLEIHLEFLLIACPSLLSEGIPFFQSMQGFLAGFAQSAEVPALHGRM